MDRLDQAGTFWSRMERPASHLIRTPTDAEHAACEWMQYWGFVDAYVSGGGGPDGGVDVDSNGAVAQVKAEMRPVSRPVVQQTFGVAAHEGKRAFVFGLSGFTEEATAWGDEAGVALFGFDLTGEPQPINTAAFAFVESASKGQAIAVVRNSYPRAIVWDPSSPQSADLGAVLARHADTLKESSQILFYGPSSKNADMIQSLGDLLAVQSVKSPTTDWSGLGKGPALANFFANTDDGGILYIERFADIPDSIVDDLVRTIATHQLTLVLGEGPAAKSITIDLPPFFVVGATDNPGSLPDRLRDVFETWIVTPFARTDSPSARFR